MAGGLLPGDAAPFSPRRYEGTFDLGLQQGVRELGIPQDLVPVSQCNALLGAYRGNGDVEPVDILGVDDLVAAAVAHTSRKVQRYQTQGLYIRTAATRWFNAGALVRFGLECGMLAEEVGADGRRAWRLLTREPAWIVEGEGGSRRAVQVRGLPPELQALQYKREATAAKRRRTYERKAREKASAEICERIDEILTRLPDAVVPALLIDHTSFRLDPFYLNVRLASVRGIIEEHHLCKELAGDDLMYWRYALRNWRAFEAPVPVAVPEPSPPAPPADIPADDADAMRWL